jgi:hypothetical protein
MILPRVSDKITEAFSSAQETEEVNCVNFAAVLGTKKLTNA